jgi:Mce-associated membrane protein
MADVGEAEDSELVDDALDADDDALDEDDEEYEGEYEGEYEDDDEYYEDDGEYQPSTLERLLAALPLIAKVAAVLLILAFVGLSAFMAWQHSEATEREKRTEAFANAAEQGVKYMTTVDYRNARSDVQRVIDSSTGEFREGFQRRLDDFTKMVEQGKLVYKGTVNAAAVELIQDHFAQVLVSATTRTTYANGQDETHVLRMRVTVSEDGGQYKMSKVEFVA